MKQTTDLGRDKVWLLVLKLAVPSMIAQFVTVLYSIIDRMFIGNIPKIGDLALAGVGICGPIVTLLTSFGTLIGLGGSILMSMRLGAGRKKQAQSILAHSFAMLVVFSAVLTLLFLLTKNIFCSGSGQVPPPLYTRTPISPSTQQERSSPSWRSGLIILSPVRGFPVWE